MAQKTHIANTASSTAMTWAEFADIVNNGTSYEGVTVYLDEDITATIMVGTNETNCFKGTFEGNNHTLTFNYTTNGWYMAPFRYLNGATIQNLKVDGTITANSSRCGGLAGHCYGDNTITNCLSDITINSSLSSDGTYGGFVSVVRTGTTTLEGCSFTGRLLGSGTYKSGGLVGITVTAVVFNNCVFDPTEVTIGHDNSATFSRFYDENTVITINNSYYTYDFNDGTIHVGQGKERYTITGQSPVTVALNGTATSHNMSHITAYSGNSGLLYNGTVIAGEGDQVSLNLDGGSNSYLPNHGTLSGTANPYTLTMEAYNTVIGSYKTHIASTASSTAMTWAEFAGIVNSGITYQGATVYLDEDITATTMVGTNETNCFQGTFEGNNHTLTFNYTTNGWYMAPFRYLNGATIQNLKVDGTITANAARCGGLAGHCYGDNTITNCLSDIIINSSLSSDGTYGGFVSMVRTGTTTFEGCSFTGKLLGSSTNRSGGLVGCTVTAVVFNNCIFDPTEVTIGHNNSATFSRKFYDTSEITINNSYYTYDFNDGTNLVGQGKQRYTVTGQSPVSVGLYGTATDHGVSHITACSGTPGLLYNGTVIAGEGDPVSLNLDGYDIGYVADHGTLTGTANPFTLTMEASNTVIFPMPCPPPTDLTVASTTATTATLQWLVNGAPTAWQICLNDDETNLIEADSNPFTLTSLTPDLFYTAKVRTNCGDALSDWSSRVTFTTPEVCPKPTNMTVSNVKPFAATVSWTGTASSYNLAVQDPVFFYDFEDATPWVEDNFAPCTTYDGDGLTTYQIPDLTPLGGYQFVGSMMTLQSGVTGFASAHGGELFGGFVAGVPAGDVEHNDDYFILPSITIEDGYVFEFWGSSLLGNWGLEHMRVGVYGGEGTITDYLAGSATDYVEVPTGWTKYSYNLSRFAGQSIQLAINSLCPDAYILGIDDIFVGYNTPTAQAVVYNDVTSPYVLELEPETTYQVLVQSVCGEDGESSWASTYFITPSICAAPTELEATDIMPTYATLNWTGYQDSYDVQYRTTAFDGYYMNETFDGEIVGWRVYNWEDGSGAFEYGIDGSYCVCFNNYYTNNHNPPQYLLSPKFESEVGGSHLTFYYKAYSQNYSETFMVGYTKLDNPATFDDFFWGEEITVSSTTWTDTPNFDEEIPVGTKYFAIQCTSFDSYYLLLDNFVIYDADAIHEVGEWVAAEGPISGKQTTITGLNPQTMYEWQVKGLSECTEGTEWSKPAFFTTLQGSTFVKHIAPYTENGGYYLIASPIAGTTDPTEVTNMLSNNYDLYRFNPLHVDNEWENYKDGSFNLENGQGYLYARSTDGTLSFFGVPYSGNGEIELVYDANDEHKCWNLIGNPYNKPASLDRPFYRMNEGGTALSEQVEASSIVGAMEGVFVQATATGQSVTFTPIAHEYVDLGLPSGLLWATCNVGAEFPEDYGDYFAWGETTPKDICYWSNYQYCNGYSTTLTKYCNNSSYGYNGFTDDLTTLLPEDDAATANWGSGWRMPTKAEFEELCNNTTVTWTRQNGVNGRLFTASNGNSLFLPAAGHRYNSRLYDTASYGYYWSSSLYSDGPYNAWDFYFNSDYYFVGSDYRYYGQSVRAVREN